MMIKVFFEDVAPTENTQTRQVFFYDDARDMLQEIMDKEKIQRIEIVRVDDPFNHGALGGALCKTREEIEEFKKANPPFKN